MAEPTGDYIVKLTAAASPQQQNIVQEEGSSAAEAVDTNRDYDPTISFSPFVTKQQILDYMVHPRLGIPSNELLLAPSASPASHLLAAALHVLLHVPPFIHWLRSLSYCYLQTRVEGVDICQILVRAFSPPNSSCHTAQSQSPQTRATLDALSRLVPRLCRDDRAPPSSGRDVAELLMAILWMLHSAVTVCAFGSPQPQPPVDAATVPPIALFCGWRRELRCFTDAACTASSSTASSASLNAALNVSNKALLQLRLRQSGVSKFKAQHASKSPDASVVSSAMASGSCEFHSRYEPFTVLSIPVPSATGLPQRSRSSSTPEPTLASLGPLQTKMRSSRSGCAGQHLVDLLLATALPTAAVRRISHAEVAAPVISPSGKVAAQSSSWLIAKLPPVLMLHLVPAASFEAERAPVVVPAVLDFDQLGSGGCTGFDVSGNKPRGTLASLLIPPTESDDSLLGLCTTADVECDRGKTGLSVSDSSYGPYKLICAVILAESSSGQRLHGSYVRTAHNVWMWKGHNGGSDPVSRIVSEDEVLSSAARHAVLLVYCGVLGDNSKDHRTLSPIEVPEGAEMVAGAAADSIVELPSASRHADPLLSPRSDPVSGGTEDSVLPIPKQRSVRYKSADAKPVSNSAPSGADAVAKLLPPPEELSSMAPAAAPADRSYGGYIGDELEDEIDRGRTIKKKRKIDFVSFSAAADQLQSLPRTQHPRATREGRRGRTRHRRQQEGQ